MAEKKDEDVLDLVNSMRRRDEHDGPQPHPSRVPSQLRSCRPVQSAARETGSTG